MMTRKIIKAPNRVEIHDHAIVIFSTVTRYCSNHYNSPSYEIYDTKQNDCVIIKWRQTVSMINREIASECF